MIAHDTLAPAFRSFRDPAGILIRQHGRILRAVHPEAVADLEAFLLTRTARDAIDRGKLVRSVRVPEATEYILEHDPVPFPSYPFEWTPEMLSAAGSLTLELACNALEEGFGLKDATPHNVLFHGSRSVFVDILSFEQRHPLDKTWMAYSQFQQTFVLPLMANRYFGLPLGSLFVGSREGIDPAAMYRLAGPIRRLNPSFLTSVVFRRGSAGGRRILRSTHPSPPPRRNKPGSSCKVS